MKDLDGEVVRPGVLEVDGYDFGKMTYEEQDKVRAEYAELLERQSENSLTRVVFSEAFDYRKEIKKIAENEGLGLTLYQYKNGVQVVVGKRSANVRYIYGIEWAKDKHGNYLPFTERNIDKYMISSVIYEYGFYDDIDRILFLANNNDKMPLVTTQNDVWGPDILKNFEYYFSNSEKVLASIEKLSKKAIKKLEKEIGKTLSNEEDEKVKTYVRKKYLEMLVDIKECKKANVVVA